MIRLYQFPPLFGLPNASPFCLKLETYLRMTRQEFQIVPIKSLGKAPKGKAPYIEDEGKFIGDTGLIIEYLKQKYGDPLDRDLTEEQRAQAVSLTRLVEEHLYWCVLYSRWKDPDHKQRVAEEFFGKLSWVPRMLLPTVYFKIMSGQLQAQGTGRHSKEEVYDMGKKDLTALSVLLDTKKFFFGDKPVSFDATAYGFLANIVWPPIGSPLKVHALSLGNIEPYCNRMKNIYYGDKAV